MAKVARGGAIGLVGAAVSALAGFGLAVVVTNAYAASTAGTFFTATSAFFILLSLATLGVDAGLGRFLLRFETLGRTQDIPLVLRAAFRPVVVVSLLLSTAVFLSAGWLAPFLGLGAQGSYILRMLALVLPAAVISDACLSGTRAFGRMRTTAFVDRMFRAGTQTAAVLVVTSLGMGVVGTTAAWAVPYVVAALFAAVALRRLARRRHSSAPAEGVVVSGYAPVRREFWSFTWPRGVTRLAQIVIQRADILIVAALRSPGEAAIYTAATRFVALGQFGTQAIQQVLQPRFTALLASGDRDTLGAVYRTSTAWSMTLSWPMYLVVGCAPAFYLRLFGEDYRDMGVPVVVTMAGAMLFAVATGPVDTLLLMHGKSALSMVNAFVALAVDLGLCFVLIPRLGVWGAALAWACAVATRCTLAVLQVRRYVGLSSVSRAALIVGALNVVCFALPLVLMTVQGWLTVPALLVTVCLGCIAYAVLLWSARDVLLLASLGTLLRRRGRQPVAVRGNDA